MAYGNIDGGHPSNFVKTENQFFTETYSNGGLNKENLPMESKGDKNNVSLN